MALHQFDSLKQLSVSHECYHCDGYFPEQFIFFLPSCILYSSLSRPTIAWHIYINNRLLFHNITRFATFAFRYVSLKLMQVYKNLGKIII